MQLQITGHITGIEARNGGWFAIAIQEQGQNYPKKLSTKKPDLVQMCQQMMGQYVDAIYNESESTNINPNNNQPYMNRYLEAVGMAGSMPQPQAPQQSFQPQPQQQPQQYQPQPVQQQPGPQAYGHVPQPQPQPVQQVMQPQPQQQYPGSQPVVTPNQKEDRIMREAAAKVAVQLLDHLDPPDRTLASVVRISEQLVGYFRDGVQWSVPPVQPQPQQPVQQQPVQQEQQPQQQYEPPTPAGGWPAPDDDIPFAPSIF